MGKRKIEVVDEPSLEELLSPKYIGKIKPDSIEKAKNLINLQRAFYGITEHIKTTAPEAKYESIKVVDVQDKYVIEFRVNDCYGRLSEIYLFEKEEGIVLREKLHGRARILLRDPVDILKQLPQDKTHHEFYHALVDKELMGIIKNTDQFDEIIVNCKSYNEMIGKLNKAKLFRFAQNLDQN